MASDDDKERLLHEYRALRIRCHKLDKFIGSAQFELLHRDEKRDLREQLEHMQAYRAVLSRRVRRLENGTSAVAKD